MNRFSPHSIGVARNRRYRLAVEQQLELLDVPVLPGNRYGWLPSPHLETDLCQLDRDGLTPREAAERIAEELEIAIRKQLGSVRA